MRLHLINEEARAIQRQQVLQHVVSLLCLLVGGLSSPDVLERLVHLLQMPIKCRAQAGAVAALQVAGSSDRETRLAPLSACRMPGKLGDRGCGG